MALVGGLVVYQGTGSAAETAFIALFGFIPTVFGAMLVITALASIWRRLQPDYREYAEYSRALGGYHIRFSSWLRLQESWWQALDGKRFEIELGMLLKRLGYDVLRTGGAGDGGIDLVLSRSGHETIVQCKAHKNLVGPGPVRDLYGTMLHSNAQEAWLVTTNGFTRAAQDFARGKGIRLIRVRELLDTGRPPGF